VSTVLIVDDDDALRIMIKRLLTGLGHTVLEARDGNEAARSCLEQPPDLVITDLVMPDMEGLELIKMLRRTYEQVKIIAMSGGVRGERGNYLFMAESMGADYTLGKPFSIEEFQSVVRWATGAETAAPENDHQTGLTVET
jgi:CheY-like chemotaxis protein